MKKKNIINWVILGLSMILVLSLSMGLILLNTLSKSTKLTYLFEDQGEAKSHIMVILDSAYSVYHEALLLGLTEQAKIDGFALEIIQLEGANYAEQVMATLKKARFAQVDGIILHAFNHPLLAEEIEVLHQANIPLVTIHEDVPGSHRISYVGVNQYQVGQAVGRLFVEELDGVGKIAYIGKQSYNRDLIGTENIKVLGIKDVFRDYEHLEVSLVTYTQEGQLSAEAIAFQIFQDYPHINGIYCDDGHNTLSVIQVMIDNNLVNQAKVIGNGDLEEILEYIARGTLIEGTTVTNYEAIGQLSVKALVEHGHKGYVSSYMDTELLILTRDTVGSYRIEKGGQDENR